MWTGPLTLVAARTILLVIGQALIAAIYLLRHHPSPWRAAAPWWTVFGTFADIGCLLLLRLFLKREGLRIPDLLGRFNFRRAHDFLLGLRYFLILMPTFLLGSVLSSLIVYGSPGPRLGPGELYGRHLPLWAVIYSLSAWWMIWSATEEITYQGYVLPRLEALSRRPWVALLIVAFWWSLQHSALPLILDWRYIAWRFGAFLPGVFVAIILYRRTRRLAPMFVSHWPMDIVAAVATLI